MPSSDDTREATPTSGGTRTGGEASGRGRDGMAGGVESTSSAKHAAEADEVVCFRLPPELWQKIVDENLHQNDLLAFAMTCRFFRDTTTDLRKKVGRTMKKRKKNAYRLDDLRKSGKVASHTLGWFQWVCDTFEIQSGYPSFYVLDQTGRVEGAVYEGDLVNCAVFQGSVEILSWLVEEKGWELNYNTGLWAVRGGSVKVLEDLRGKGYEFNEETCDGAAQGGHLEALKFLRGLDPPCPWDGGACSGAALGGHLEVLKWARAQEPPCPWSDLTCASAAFGGHLDVLKWARSQDPPCPWTDWTCSEAANGGQLHILKWARSQDPPCPWDERTCYDACGGAAGGGHLDVLKWARAQDPPCPWSRSECREQASIFEHQHVIDWIDQQEDESDVEYSDGEYSDRSYDSYGDDYLGSRTALPLD